MVVSALLLVFGLAYSGSGFETAVSDLGSVRSPNGEGDTVGNLVLETEAPGEIDVSGSESVRVALIIDGQGAPGEPQPTAVTRDDVDLDGTYTLVSAEASLQAAAFEVAEPPNPRQSVQGRDRLEWEWNLSPNKSGDQSVTLLVDMELTEEDGSIAPPRHHRELLRIDVTEAGGFSEYIKSVPAVILSLLTALVGSALSVPFYYNLWKEGRGQASRSSG
jgi:hypothetical protein